jgi:pSer/pThr/pTyr-binding forkhead associated (FHA) protein
MRRRKDRPQWRVLAGVLRRGAAVGLLGGMALGMWGRGGSPRRSSRKLPSQRGASPGVDPDQRLVEPLGPGVAWGQLEDLVGKYGGQPFALTRQIIILGRQSDCDIILDDDRASRYHLFLTWDHDKGYARDNQSTNGTVINGQACQGPVVLHHGDIIEVAGSEFRFTYTEATGLATLEAQPTEKFALLGVPAPEARPQVQARLTALTGPEPGRSWPIIAGVISIGRGGDNLVVLPHASVSRHHAQIVVQPAGLYFQDIGSSNGASVNGEAVVAPRLLRDGDHIQIGDILLVLKLEAPAPGSTEDIPTQYLPTTMPSVARIDPDAAPPYHGARTRPASWHGSPPAAPSQPSSPPPTTSAPGQFRPPATYPLPPDGARHLPRFRPPASPTSENTSPHRSDEEDEGQ